MISHLCYNFQDLNTDAECVSFLVYGDDKRGKNGFRALIAVNGVTYSDYSK
jgi:hypothetical protein